MSLNSTPQRNGRLKTRPPTRRGPALLRKPAAEPTLTGQVVSLHEIFRPGLNVTFNGTPFAALAALAIFSQAPRAPSDFLVRDVRVFDGERVLPRRDVLVENGSIVRITPTGAAPPRSTPVIDGRGRTLLPGLIDAHVHLSDSTESDLRQTLALGVTTVLDMWNGAARYEVIKALRAADPANVSAVRTAGVGASAPGGHPSQMGGPPFPALADSLAAAAFVAARVAEGSDYIKVIYDDLATMGAPVPMLERRTLAAVVEAAHALGRLAVVHVLTEAQAREAIESGADGIVHLFAAATAGPDFGEFVARHGAFVIPTLTIMSQNCGQPTAPRVMRDSLLIPYVRPSLRPLLGMSRQRGEPASCEGTRAAVKDLVAHGVRVVAGTDSPVPGHTYGASLHAELELLVEAGLTPMQALAAATATSAASFRLDDRGRIAEGLRADLVLVEGDPTADVRDARRIVTVWKRGVAVERRRYE